MSMYGSLHNTRLRSATNLTSLDLLNLVIKLHKLKEDELMKRLDILGLFEFFCCYQANTTSFRSKTTSYHRAIQRYDHHVDHRRFDVIWMILSSYRLDLDCSKRFQWKTDTNCDQDTYSINFQWCNSMIPLITSRFVKSSMDWDACSQKVRHPFIFTSSFQWDFTF